MKAGAVLKEVPPRFYQFTSDWFSANIPFWNAVIEHHRPCSVLEVGCYEGRATTYLIERCASFGLLRLTCVDTWAGGVDLEPSRMIGVEGRFDSNVDVAIKGAPNPVWFNKIKEPSGVALSRLRASGDSFDFIYIDGSHTAPDVLTDAVLAFDLLNIGGVMVFDDYLWGIEPDGQQDLLNMPKMAIDAFVNIFARKLKVMSFAYQLAIVKTRE